MVTPRSYEVSLKNSWWRRNLTLAAIALLKRFRPYWSQVLLLTPGICIKYGKFQHLSSAEAMQTIASNTSIPVPKIYCAFERMGITYIVMSRLKAVRSVKEDYIDEMRCLKPPAVGVVEGVNGSMLYDLRVSGDMKGYGPFDSVPSFHSFLTNAVEQSTNQFPEINQLLAMYQTSQFTTCFTHGDLNSANILVDGDRIAGIVDWDTCGWYPEYWEYTTAWNVNPYNEFWREEVGKFLVEYPDALRMEEIRRKYFGDF
ncbi:hypothetical protein LOZ65_001997 [Ophidiomyces ophidiicola]|nr:hypothetical protein LOZ65_001997 [Ophidiomyces ophidiicola]